MDTNTFPTLARPLRIWPLGIVFLLLFISLMSISYSALYVQSTLRAYVGGEGHWSKSQKEAVLSLLRYTQAGEQQDYNEFIKNLDVPLGDRSARLTMLSRNYDYETAAKGLERGKNTPRDIPAMIRLFRCCHQAPYMKQAVIAWTEADRYIMKLHDLGENIKAVWSNKTPDNATKMAWRAEIFRLDALLRTFEDRFSSEVTKGAQVINQVLFAVILFGSALAFLIGGILVRRTLLKISDWQLRFRSTFEQAAVGMIHESLGGEIQLANERFCLITGQDRETLSGYNISHILHSPDTQEDEVQMQRMLNGETKSYTSHKRLGHSETSTRWVRVTKSLISSPHGAPQYFLSVIEDISEEKHLSERLSYQATHDALTGIFNRYEFERVLQSALEKITAGGPHGVLFHIDLDQFKVTNDSLGHIAGDHLLREVTQVMKKSVRSGDTLARLGGDEFAVILEGCPLEVGIIIAEQLRHAVESHHVTWDGHSLSATISMGVTTMTSSHTSTEQLLNEVDTACYAAKDKGRNYVHVLRSDDINLQRRQSDTYWASCLRDMIANDQLQLYYQTIVPLQDKNKTIDMAEILLRVPDAQGNMISPADFLAAAERYKLASRIDEWVVRTMLAWLKKHHKILPLSTLWNINLSAQSISDERFLDFVIQQIEGYQLPPDIIGFEITETAAVADIALAQQFITPLRELGCRFSLDDFGTGMSSFAYLRNLPVDYVKIDGSFIQQISSNPTDRALVTSINAISHTLGKKTIAEFVESEEIFASAAQIGVDYAQGYVVSRPQPLDIFHNTSPCLQATTTRHR